MTALEVAARQRLDNALRDYIAEITEGGILTDFVVITAATTLDDIGTGRTIYSWLNPPTQAPHVTMGLLAYAEQVATVDDDE